MSVEHKYQIVFKDWWGKESTLFDPECILYTLKDQFVKKLLIEGLIDMNDMDDRNKTPHVRVCDKRVNPKDQKCYDKINRQIRTLSLKDIDFHNDWIDTSLGHSTSFETHMTLIFKKGIGAHKARILPILEEIIANLKPQPIVVPNLQASVSSSASTGSVQGSSSCLCTNCMVALQQLKTCQCHYVNT
jgi:hypothetical protein